MNEDARKPRRRKRGPIQSPRPSHRPIVLAGGGGDDRVRPFALERAGVRGRMVRLGPVLDEILSLHDYPEPLAGQLARLTALAALLGSMVKTDGRVTVQARGGEDAPLAYMVADVRIGAEGEPAGLRAYASRRRQGPAAPGPKQGDLAAWVGARGDLAITLEFTRTGRRYQGIVPVSDGDLARAAEAYFAQSEQIPTRIALAAARHRPSRGWRAGGLLVQHMPETGGRARAEAGEGDEDAWPRVQMLFETLTQAELVDPALDDDTLLFRLFHEEEVRVFPPVRLVHRCSCSTEKVRRMLASFSKAEREDMREEDGLITVACEYCGRRYRLRPEEVEGARGDDEG